MICTDYDFQDFTNGELIIPNKVDEFYSSYFNVELPLYVKSRPCINLNIKKFYDLYVVLHEASLIFDKLYVDENHKVDRYIKKWNDPNNMASTHLFATDKGIYQFVPINEKTFHCGTVVGTNGIGNISTVGIERQVTVDTNQSIAIYNQAKGAASVIKFYSKFFNATPIEEVSFVENNVITHTTASTGISLKNLEEGFNLYKKYRCYFNNLNEEEKADYIIRMIVPSLMSEPRINHLKLCPSRTILGMFGGMETIKMLILDCLYRYNNGDDKALFSNIVDNSQLILKLKK